MGTGVDKLALEIGHPTESTNNLYAYALLTKKYNKALRDYAKEQQQDVIDFESYAFSNFVPRSAYFHDSIHPNIEGYSKMAKYFADELIRIKNFKTK